MSEQEEIGLFNRIRENIQATQRKLYERKAKLGENVVIADENGQPIIVPASQIVKMHHEASASNEKKTTQR